MTRILIAEDEPDIQLIAGRILGDRGFEVAAALDGVEALAQLPVGHDVGLLILDIRIPQLDGFAVLEALADPDRRGALRILGFSAHVDRPVIQKALDSGCDAFLTKPFRSQELIAEVEKLLNPDES